MSLAKFAQELENLTFAVQELSQSIRISGNQVIVTGGLSDISERLGLVRSGEFRSGNEQDPSKGFTGVRIGYPGFVYGTEIWNFAGVNNDVLQAGIRASDGKFLAGGGSVILDVDGLGLHLISGTAGQISDIYWFDEDGNNIIETYTSYTALDGVATWLLLMGSGGSSKAANHLVLQAQNNVDGGIAMMSLLGQAGGSEVVFNDLSTVCGFRIESDNQEYAFYLNPSNGYIGLNVSDPDTRLEILHAGDQLKLSYDGTDNAVFAVDTNGDLTITVSGDEIKVADWVRHTSADYRRYFHLTVGGFDPGASGATWTNPDANTTGGWQLNAVGETLIAGTDIHADWDAASDIIVDISFALNASGNPNDTVDLKLVAYYNGIGDTATKTQTVEVATTTDGTQYKVYKATFTIDHDKVDNVVDVGDTLTFALNLETDTSEIDNIIVLHGSFYYNTTHLGIESGDV